MGRLQFLINQVEATITLPTTAHLYSHSSNGPASVFIDPAASSVSHQPQEYTHHLIPPPPQLHPSVSSHCNKYHHHHHPDRRMVPTSTPAATVVVTPTGRTTTTVTPNFSEMMMVLEENEVGNDVPRMMDTPQLPITSAAVVSSSSSAASPSSCSSSFMDLYVVQKCWYSGPHVTPTMDYMRLLRTASDAEQIAYHSAHLFATMLASQNTNGHNIVVRTITLPSSSASSTSNDNHHNGIPQTNHAFVAAGQLFWIRRVRAMVVHHHSSYTNSNDDAPPQWDHAHCIVTNAIIGGNGHNVRRRTYDDHHHHDGADTEEPIRVFVGPQSSHMALQLIVNASSSSSSNRSPHPSCVPPGSTVQWVPVGSPSQVEQIQNEWPTTTRTTADGRLVVNDADDQNGYSPAAVGNPNHPTVGPPKRTMGHVQVEHDRNTVWYNQQQQQHPTKPLPHSNSTTLNPDPFIWRSGGPSGSTTTTPSTNQMSAPSSLLLRPNKRPCRPMDIGWNGGAMVVHEVVPTTTPVVTTTTSSTSSIHGNYGSFSHHHNNNNNSMME
jgi:hypothetical protein